MAPEAHAMPGMAMMASASSSDMVSSHCSGSVEADVQHKMEQHDGCTHCDAADQFYSVQQLSFDHSMAATFIIVSSLNDGVGHVATAVLRGAQAPTGPPRSSSLLYTTSRRILI